MATGNRSLHFFDLPCVVKEKILSYMTFEELAHLRIVCRRFDSISQVLLNKGFRQVEKYQAKCLREVKSQLPRRESERRNHPLFRHCDILTAIETRLSLLNMTFMKYVDSRMCCFIPGKVIDEIYRVLHFIQSYKNKSLPRPHEILTELRDISSMAMEHFEDKIVGSLKPMSITSPSPRFSISTALSQFSSAGSSGSASGSLTKSHSQSPSSDDVSDLTASNKYLKYYINTLKKDFHDMKSKVNELRRKMSEQEKVALEHNRIIAEQTTKLTVQEGKLTEFNRKMMDYEQRLNVLGAGGAGAGEGAGAAGGAGVTRDKTSGREDTSQQFYVTHGLPTSAISSGVFVPANIIQPSLVSLGASPMAAAAGRAYLPSSPLPGFSSASTGQDSSSMLSHTLSPPAGYSASHCLQGSIATCSDPASDTTSQLDNISLPGSTSSTTTTTEEDSINKMHSRKRRKRKYMDEDGNSDSHSKHSKV